MTWLSPLFPAGRIPIKNVRRICIDDEARDRELRKQRYRNRWKRWYLRNAERKKAYMLRWRAENPEIVRRMHRDWQERNRTWKRLYQREWAKKKRAENIAKGLTGRGRPRKPENPSHFKKGWRSA